MSVPTVTNNTSPVSAGSATSASDLNRQDFLQLLVTQLQHQDPLSPVDDQQFIAQMAQLSALDATNQLAAQVGRMAAAQQEMGSLQLVGRDVQYTDDQGSSQKGKVTGVRLDGPTPTLLVGDSEVPLEQVQTVL
jgi:flagellar basal-body rod modification protein FlgD